jgi:hypothetical protein
MIRIFLFTCSVSTKFATAPSSLTPRTLNLVPARSQLNLIESKTLLKKRI